MVQLLDVDKILSDARIKARKETAEGVPVFTKDVVRNALTVIVDKINEIIKYTPSNF